MIALLFVAVFVTTFTMLARPVFVLSDRRLARRRLHVVPLRSAQQPFPPRHTVRDSALAKRLPFTTFSKARVATAPTYRHSSLCLDDIARQLRLGESSVDAFTNAVRVHLPTNTECANAALESQRTGDLRSAVSDLAQQSTGVVREFAQAVRISHVGRNLNIAALERAAIAHRDRWVVHEEKRTATAASRYSMNVLVLLPVASLVLSPMWGGSILSAISQSGAVSVGMLIGVILNLTGFVWCRRVSGSVA